MVVERTITSTAGLIFHLGFLAKLRAHIFHTASGSPPFLSPATAWCRAAPSPATSTCRRRRSRIRLGDCRIWSAGRALVACDLCKQVMLAPVPMTEKSREGVVVGNARTIGDRGSVIPKSAMAIGAIEEVDGSDCLFVVEFRRAGKVGNCRCVLAHLVKEVGAAVVAHGVR